MVVISTVAAVVVVAFVVVFCYRWCCLHLLFVFTSFTSVCAVGVVVDVIMVTVAALISSLRHGERSTILYTCHTLLFLLSS